MKTMKTILAASTAIALAGAAWADENEAYLLQDGNGNDAPIAQSGEGNVAGRVDDPMEQDGDDNDLKVLQQGDDNSIGATSKGGNGLDQSGNNNSADISQTSDWNFVNQVQQSAEDGSAGNSNELTITQTASNPNAGTGNTVRWGNVVGTVSQTNTGGASNTVTILQDRNTGGGPGGNGANVIASKGVLGNKSDRLDRVDGGVFQSGTGNNAELTQQGEQNLIREVNQDGADNDAIVSQDGEKNLIELVEQSGDDNDLSVTMDGDRNGRPLLTGAADVAGDGSFRQSGLDNFIRVDISGNDTGIGVEQRGDGNSVGTLTINGDSNEIGIAQRGETTSGESGDYNTVALGVIDGSSNIVGITQLNDGNEATVNIIDDSDDNTVSILQEDKFGSGDATVNIEGENTGGDDNTVTIVQQAFGTADVGIEGDDNDVSITQFNRDFATVRIDGTDTASSQEGDNNFLSIVQGESTGGSRNDMEVSIFGDDNNRDSFTGGALVAAKAATGYQTPLQPGELTQQGQNNSMTLTIGFDGGANESDDNLFAASQFGNSNELTGTIDGNYNQAVVVQTGNSQVASFSQTGTGNNAAITQN